MVLVFKRKPDVRMRMPWDGGGDSVPKKAPLFCVFTTGLCIYKKYFYKCVYRNGIETYWLSRQLWGLSLWTLHQDMKTLESEITWDFEVTGRWWEQHFRTGLLDVRATIFQNLCLLMKAFLHQTLIAQVVLTVPHVRNTQDRLRRVCKALVKQMGIWAKNFCAVWQVPWCSYLSGSKYLLPLLCDIRDDISEEPHKLVLKMKRGLLSC